MSRCNTCAEGTPCDAPAPDRPDQLARVARWIPLILVAAAIVAHAPGVGGAFTLWDDHNTIVENPSFAPPTLAGLARHWREPHMDLYVPITYTAWWVIAKLAWRGGVAPDGYLDARPFHAANLTLHVLATLVAYALLRRLLQRPGTPADTPQRCWAAAAGALLFAAHPVQVESVGWISGLKDVLGGLLVLTAVWQYVLFADPQPDPAPGGRRGRGHYVLGMLALGAALLTKPIAVVAPALVVVLDLLILNRPWRQVARSAWPWFVLIVPCLVWTKLCQPAAHVTAPALWQRPLVAGDALAFYLFKLVAPLNLAPDYSRSPMTVLAGGWAYWTWLMPAAVAVALWRWRREARPAVAAALFAVAALSPLLGLVPFDFQVYSTVADHYLYLPMFGVALGAAWGLSRLDSSHRRARRLSAGPLACALGLVVLVPLSARQARVWRDTVTLFEHTIAVNPDSYAGYSNLASQAYRQARDAEIDADTAQLVFDVTGRDRHLAEAQRLDAQYLGYAEQCYRIWPSSIQAQRRMGDALLRAGRAGEAVPYLRQAMATWEAANGDRRHKYATTPHLLGSALLRTGDAAEAAACFERTLAVLPDHGPSLEGLATARRLLSSSATTPPSTADDTKTAAGF